MPKTKQRFALVVPYLLAITILLGWEYLFPAERVLFALGPLDLLLGLLISPWIYAFSALVVFLGLEGNGVAEFITIIASVAVNAAILYYVGRKFEKAPATLPR